MVATAFLFPGQGAQYVGVAGSLCDTLPAARQLFAEAAEVLGYDLLEICVKGPVERLNSTVISQPAIFVASLAALEALRQREPDTVAACTATAGLSLGEYTALVFSGALSFRDGLSVVRSRGEAMQAAADANPGTMVSVLAMDKEALEPLVAAASSAGYLRIANFLCPGNLAVSGDRAACALERLVLQANGRTVRLAVAGAFHTPLMKPADERLAAALTAVPFKAPRIPVWSNVDARPHTEPNEIRALLVRQVVQPVLWEESMRALLAAGCEPRFYEIGPGRVLAGLLKRVQRKVDCQNISA